MSILTSVRLFEFRLERQMLTEKQKEVLHYIQDYSAEHGIPPSVREIAQGLGKSAQAIQQHIESLRSKGFLQHQPSKSRAHVPIQSRTSRLGQVREIPLLGQVQAGVPVMAEQNLEGTVWLPVEWARGDQVFLLRVKGTSMEGAHILPGDLALVRRQPTAESGEIVVARIEGSDATLKRFYPKVSKVLLKAENPDFQSIEVSATAVEIIGKVIGVYRKLG
ncbi:MAG: transcriptional repressor LexA [Acidobacteriota bacterium]